MLYSRAETCPSVNYISYRYPIGLPLITIILPGVPAVIAPINKILNELPDIVQLIDNFFPAVLVDIEAVKAADFLAAGTEDLKLVKELVLGLVQFGQELDQQGFEVLEVVGVETAHEFEVLFGHLEWGTLEVDAAGFGVEDEGEVDVEEGAVFFDHEVGVIPVFYL